MTPTRYHLCKNPKCLNKCDHPEDAYCSWCVANMPQRRENETEEEWELRAKWQPSELNTGKLFGGE